VANKRRKKKGSWLKKLLLLVSIPLICWFAAFVIWFYWNNLTRLFTGSHKQGARPAPKASARSEPGDNSEAPPSKRPQEKILEEDRKKLEDILKRRN
jgi:hypothetical protein